MGERTGLSTVEHAVLEALDETGARPDGPHRKSVNVLLGGEATRAIGLRYAYDALCCLAQPWRMNVPLVEIHGNVGGPNANDTPANPRYTEARLTRGGVLALASERGDAPRLPFVLMNGDLHLNGTQPPFDPESVVRGGGTSGRRDRAVPRRSSSRSSALRACLPGPSCASICERSQRPDRQRCA